MRSVKLATIAILAAVALSQAAGCGNTSSNQGVRMAGTVRLPLSATVGANSYLLVASFIVTSASGATTTLDSNSAPNAVTLSTTLDVGQYTITIQPGWQLYLVSSAGALNPVDATLTSDATQSVTVSDQQNTVVTYQFASNGTIIQLGQGELTIQIGVTENAGGAGSVGGASSTGGAISNGGSTSGGACEAGTTATAWASNCPTAPTTTCTAGNWVAAGPDTSNSTFTLCSESAHFAVYSDEACTTAAQAALTHLETVWNLYFGSPMFMKEPLCNSTAKYKASIMVHSTWGLTGGSWATGRIGMWLGQGALSDHWGLAHEFMHGVQSVEGGLVCNQSNTCGWIFESHANWAAQQLAEYHSAYVHCSEMLPNASHLYLGTTRERYCNWQFMEYLKDKYCFSAVNDIWTSTPTDDPFTAIRNSRGWSVSQLNDFFGDWAMHNVTWDYQDPAPQVTAGVNQGSLFRSKYGPVTDISTSERRLRLVKMESMDLANRRFVTPSLHAPQRWGYNIVRLFPDSGATSVTVTFRGVIQSGADSDFRWGLVATDSAITQPRYSSLQRGTDGQLAFCVNPGESLFLVVTATPSVQKQIVWDQIYPSIYRYPYMIQLGNAWPEGFQGGTQAACPANTIRVANGGGCAPANLPSSVYVGPYAQVLGGTVSGTARIDDHAIILGGTVTGGTVSGLSIVTSNMTISGGTESAAWAYAPGYFEAAQSISGTAQLLGDIEYRGTNLTKSSGSYCGYVDDTVTSNCTAADVTQAAPYTWRP